MIDSLSIPCRFLVDADRGLGFGGGFGVCREAFGGMHDLEVAS